jgi:hypothetical protein
MKHSSSVVFVASLLCSASAFTSPSSTQTTSVVALRMSEISETGPGTPPAPPAPLLPKMSESLPFLERPAMLDGAMAGDVGFDPFGFAKTEKDLVYYREAEIKHARLAMLAAAGWPLSELLDSKIASWLHLPAVVDAADRAPSLLNGGLGKISPVYWVACVLAAGAIDLYGGSKVNDKGYFPGKLGFDPLGLYPKDDVGKKRMQLAEIKNGRLSMIAITAFAFQEFVSQLGVVDETPLFFKPLGYVLKEYANSGYIVPH